MNRFPYGLKLDSWSPERIRAAGYDHAFYTVEAMFCFISSRHGAIIVPPGLVTDFASIPRLVWNIIDPESPEIQWPSVIHDYIYTAQGTLPDKILSREEADGILVEAMEVCGASAWQRWAVYKAVRHFGASHWTA